ncbi:uncharacterized protein LOC143265993 isoform X1 [Megachile rotundata]|uniref:uncharacterized protein LOC143265993 isoform X1 n=1 Tax=Megachile rotundata TaxID=143995 RepID=UPI003FD6652E
MGDIKARFHFVSEAVDSKTTEVKVKTIQLVGQPEIFKFPEGAQTKAEHPNLFENQVTKGVVKSLKLRNKFRNVVITLAEGKLKDSYVDHEGNVVFDGYYLEAIQTDSPIPSNHPAPENPPQEKPIHSISKNIILEKFNGKNFNAESWMKIFVAECKRLEIKENKYPEVLRLFLEGPASNWFSIFLKTNSLTCEWEHWNKSFMDTFNQKSWSEIAYAYTFRYLNGPFLDFALKKRNMLIDIDPDLTINSQINLIVIALPHFVKSRLERKNLTNIDNLMSLLSQMEPINNRNFNEKKDDKQKYNEDRQTNQRSRKPCAYCESVGFKNRFHPEEVCRTKTANRKTDKNDKIKIANNIEIEDAVSFTEEARNV